MNDKPEKSREVAKAEPADLQTYEELSPLSIIRQAVTSGADPDTLAKLMDLQERYQANEAKRAFTRALNAFKANPPEIFKTSAVDYTPQGKARVHYMYAALDTVCGILNPALRNHGLSFRWETATENNLIKVTCVLTHELGHSEETSLQCTADQSGGKNPIQAIGSAVTYLQRYTLLAATGMAVQGQDDDGRSSQQKEEAGPVSEEQRTALQAALDDAGLSAAALCKWLRVSAVPEIKAADFDKAMGAIRRQAADARGQK
jgi:hypothetical protein